MSLFGTLPSVAPDVLGPPPTFTTNRPFPLSLTVNNGAGYWSTNGSPFASFSSNGVILWVSNTTTLRFFGKSTNGVVGATNACSYTFNTTPPVLSVAPLGLATNAAFRVSLGVNENSGFWSTNGSLFLPFTTKGTNLIVYRSTTLRVFGVDILGNVGTTNTYRYDFTGAPLYPPEVKEFQIIAGPPGGGVSLVHRIDLGGNASCQVAFDYRETTRTNWTPIPGTLLSRDTADNRDQTMTNRWNTAALDPYRRYDVRITPSTALMPGEPQVLSNVDIAPVWTDMKGVVAANNPSRNGTPLIFLNVPNDGRIDIYSVSRRPVTSLPKPPGTPYIKWNLNTSSGRRVPPGVYICEVVSGSARRSLMVVVQ